MDLRAKLHYWNVGTFTRRSAMSEQATTILKESSVAAARSGRLGHHRVKGCLVVSGAVLVSGLGLGSTSGAAASAAGAATRADPQANVVQSQLREPTGSAGCRGCSSACRGELWSMSRLHGSTVWVGDQATGRIHVYRLDGRRLRVINTGLGRERLMGFRVDSQGSLSVLDARENRTLQLRASQT
jgi:hypothetical protein